MKRIASGLLVAALAAGASVTVVTLAEAQTMAGQPPTPPPHGPGREDHGLPDGHMMREVERLKTSLRLTPSQVALWDRAQQQTKAPGDLHEQMTARHERMVAMLDDPDFDPRKLAADMDSADSDRRTRMTAVREAWFAVYASLNPAQRGQVREFLRARLSHRGGMPEHGGGPHGHDGDAGRSPPPPPAPAR